MLCRADFYGLSTLSDLAESKRDELAANAPKV
jgi:hypothetical protein